MVSDRPSNRASPIAETETLRELVAFVRRSLERARPQGVSVALQQKEMHYGKEQECPDEVGRTGLDPTLLVDDDGSMGVTSYPM
jgi:hypothetical protein